MKLTTFVLPAALSLTALPVFAALSTGDVVGTTEADIRAALEKDGYVVQSIEVEDDEIEVAAVLDGAAFEIELDPATGEILEIEAEDGDDDEDDDDDK